MHMKMKNKLLVLISILTLLPFIARGQNEVIDVDLSEGGAENPGYTITENDKTYHFTGTYIGTPGQAIYDDSKHRNAVINIDHTVTKTTIILDNVDISLTEVNQCPLFAGDTKEVTLELRGSNTLSTINTWGNSPGLWAPEGKGYKLIIQNANEDKDGTLIAQGTYRFSGIGTEQTTGQGNEIIIKSGIVKATGGPSGAGIEVSSDDKLTIEGGFITAKGGDYAAGIGGGDSEAGGTCIIEGGTVTAIGGGMAAGIGGGYNGPGESCTITGGIVTAIGGTWAAGIGGGNKGAGGTCIITGGTVTAIGSSNAVGIGKGSLSNSGTSDFSTKDKDNNPGNAFIITNGITDNNTDKKTTWSGVIFEDAKNGKVYGTNIELTTDAVIEAGKTLTIESGQSLTINNDITLANLGTIDNKEGSIFTNNGTILNISSGKITNAVSGTQAKMGYQVTYNSNYGDEPDEVIDYVTSETKLSYNGFSYPYHTFDNWYDQSTDGSIVENISENKTVYAHWNKNELKTISDPYNPISCKTGVAISAYELSALLAGDSYQKGITYRWNDTDEEHYGLSITDTKITGTPNKITDPDATLAIKIRSSYCEAPIIVNIPITVSKGLATIEDLSVSSPYAYTGKAIEITAPKVKDESDNEIKDATLSYQIDINGDGSYEQTTAENSGASEDGSAPANAGSYQVIASFTDNDNYEDVTDKVAQFTINKATATIIPSSVPITKIYDGNTKVTTAEVLTLEGIINDENVTLSAYELTYNNADAGEGKPITIPALSLEGATADNYQLAEPFPQLTGAIAPKDLIITPASGQSIYQEEAATYEPFFTLDGAIREEAENVTYKGKLGWNPDTKTITTGDLALVSKDNFKEGNYELKLAGQEVAITIEDTAIPDAKAESSSGENNWYTSDITLTPPAGFQIKAIGKTRTAEDWQSSVIISEEGIYGYSYSLQRTNQTASFDKTIPVKLDKTKPILSVTSNELSYTLTFSDTGSGIDRLFIDGTEVSPATGTTYTAIGTAGSHKATVTDQAGWSSEVEFTLEKNTPVDPPVPDPVYYNVTLPETTGVIFSPEAGEYAVREWYDFTFTVTVAEGYRQQSVPVVKVNGNVISPKDDNGHYKITNILEDKTVTVEGILKDLPTANESIAADAIAIHTEGHTLYVTAVKPALFRLVDTSGRLVCSRQLSVGMNRIDGIATGIYFVVVEGEGVRKIFVK